MYRFVAFISLLVGLDAAAAPLIDIRPGGARATGITPGGSVVWNVNYWNARTTGSFTETVVDDDFDGVVEVDIDVEPAYRAVVLFAIDLGSGTLGQYVSPPPLFIPGPPLELAEPFVPGATEAVIRLVPFVQIVRFTLVRPSTGEIWWAAGIGDGSSVDLRGPGFVGFDLRRLIPLPREAPRLASVQAGDVLIAFSVSRGSWVVATAHHTPAVPALTWPLLALLTAAVAAVAWRALS